MSAKSVFAALQPEAYPFVFEGELTVGKIMGGTPSDPRVAEGWLKSRLMDSEALLQEKVASVMLERGLDAEGAVKAVDELKHLNGFKRDDQGLYIEGRQLKAAIKEAASVALAAGKIPARGWGKTNKGLLSYLAEHVFVVQDRLHLGVAEASGVEQRFVHTWRGTGIQYEEFVLDAKIRFSVVCDHDFKDAEWAAIWMCGEKQGIGASRSQGFGRYAVTRWDRVQRKTAKSS